MIAANVSEITKVSKLKIAIILGDFSKQFAISLEREKYLSRLLYHFEKSYASAITIEQNRIRLKIRDKHIEIINNIMNEKRRVAYNDWVMALRDRADIDDYRDQFFR